VWCDPKETAAREELLEARDKLKDLQIHLTQVRQVSIWVGGRQA